ncbi:hypothetical protein D9611_007542 [Ephemerocybe angulata]|uniref:HMG box domain-containing protein n=1 Tax=Ephemerocybe angulata TaxID=980116 RepID=A0A8H5BYV3_9AGAR|nr:hypothetical protein D9611_007542 [Tulosesus angulatus]
MPGKIASIKSFTKQIGSAFKLKPTPRAFGSPVAHICSVDSEESASPVRGSLEEKDEPCALVNLADVESSGPVSNTERLAASTAQTALEFDENVSVALLLPAETPSSGIEDLPQAAAGEAPTDNQVKSPQRTNITGPAPTPAEPSVESPTALADVVEPSADGPAGTAEEPSIETSAPTPELSVTEATSVDPSPESPALVEPSDPESAPVTAEPSTKYVAQDAEPTLVESSSDSPAAESQSSTPSPVETFDTQETPAPGPDSGDQLPDVPATTNALALSHQTILSPAIPLARNDVAPALAVVTPPTETVAAPTPSGTKRKRTAKKNDGAIKAPNNSYLFFAAAFRADPANCAVLEGKHAGPQAKVISAAWEKLKETDPAKAQEYEALAKRAKEEHRVKYPGWVEKRTSKKAKTSGPAAKKRKAGNSNTSGAASTSGPQQPPAGISRQPAPTFAGPQLGFRFQYPNQADFTPSPYATPAHDHASLFPPMHSLPHPGGTSYTMPTPPMNMLPNPAGENYIMPPPHMNLLPDMGGANYVQPPPPMVLMHNPSGADYMMPQPPLPANFGLHPGYPPLPGMFQPPTAAPPNTNDLYGYPHGMLSAAPPNANNVHGHYVPVPPPNMNDFYGYLSTAAPNADGVHGHYVPAPVQPSISASPNMNDFYGYLHGMPPTYPPNGDSVDRHYAPAPIQVPQPPIPAAGTVASFPDQFPGQGPQYYAPDPAGPLQPFTLANGEFRFGSTQDMQPAHPIQTLNPNPVYPGPPFAQASNGGRNTTNTQRRRRRGPAPNHMEFNFPEGYQWSMGEQPQ